MSSPSQEHREFSVALTLCEGYQFDVEFAEPETPSLVVDEVPPLGEGDGPNPVRLLATAVGHCLSASLLFCLRKSHIDVEALRARVSGDLVRNERGRLRVGRLRVEIQPTVATPEDRERLGRCLSLFEDFCIVTESVRKGIEVDVRVAPTVERETLEAVP